MRIPKLILAITALLMVSACHRHPCRYYIETGLELQSDALTFFSSEGVRCRAYGAYIRIPRSRKSFKALLEFSGYLKTGSDLAEENISTYTHIKVNEKGTYLYKTLSLESDGRYTIREEEKTDLSLVYDPNHPEAHSSGYVSYPAIDMELERKKLREFKSLYNSIYLLMERENFWVFGSED